ncbi:MAG: TIGR03790 family protein [Verrucomicrobiota bacterium]
MPTRFPILFVVFVCLLGFSALAHGAAIPNTELAKLTAVIYNSKSKDSKKLAEEYVRLRGIPEEQLVGLDCSMAEMISRAEYEQNIARPLRAKFAEKGWWKIGAAAGGQLMATENKIRVLAVISGIPLRIESTPGPIDPKTNKPTKLSAQATDAASVDSELALLGIPEYERKSMGRNAYFQQNQNIRDANMPMFMVVSRLDGPVGTPKRLIEDALEVERNGLFGRAYIDLARLELTKGETYKLGDTWLQNAAKVFRITGVPIYVDSRPERFPPFYPLGEDVIFYFGWYTQYPDGPFKHGDFKFRKGAVASHLHSFSAPTVRRADNSWCAKLLQQGACATFGNVYEPFLTMTTNYDVFIVRFMEGYTFAEAAWMATPATSWMNTMVGDPLYQPFSNDLKLGTEGNVAYKAMRVAAINANNDREALRNKVEEANTSLKSPILYEALGLEDWELARNVAALENFKKAGGLFTDLGDKLRMRLHEVEMLRGEGKKDEALKLLRALEAEFAGVPEAGAVKAWINQLDPPPPPMPKK